jgi:hypothetical protein
VHVSCKEFDGIPMFWLSLSSGIPTSHNQVLNFSVCPLDCQILKCNPGIGIRHPKSFFF